MSKQENDNDDRSNASSGSASSDNASTSVSAGSSTGTNGAAENAAVTGESTRTGHMSGPDASQSGVSGSGRAFEPGDMRPEHRPRQKSGRRSVLLPILLVLLLLSLAAIGFGAWLFEQQRNEMDQLRQDVTQVQQSTRQSTGEVSGALESSDQRLGQLQSKLEENDQALSRVMEELTRSQQTDERQWQNAEIEYLLRMANQRLQLERDISGAQSLLETADQRLRQIDNPAQLPVRRAIASELSQLKSLPDVDQNGLFLTLSAMAGQVDDLPLSQESEALSAQKDDGSLFTGGWREQLSRMGTQLKDLVTVRRHDEPLEALITPTQEGYLRQNVRLLLEQAQLGVMRSNEEIYRESLERAGTLITTYFRTEDSNVQRLQKQLESLSQRNISPELPDISGSVDAINKLQNARRNGEGASS
ncbi:uroporphyrinogen-III C-methyltransferase [Kushneria phyllosphaerae]|uniref:Uroporphyrinogen-III C-methyltransferase n=1 Tax=Kushneria phyllosphaerae TaxID=2100822 RepID=A0A2R8CIW2_9GAMM|nr:uroporphyrinogen-III C-methyltransferase [Kushneria phyllosphaerae]SPJ32752.1 Putative uroporphyrinogen-III C-methyltransferase [Kushneria phyllosphaerae]